MRRSNQVISGTGSLTCAAPRRVGPPFLPKWTCGPTRLGGGPALALNNRRSPVGTASRSPSWRAGPVPRREGPRSALDRGDTSPHDSIQRNKVIATDGGSRTHPAHAGPAGRRVGGGAGESAPAPPGRAPPSPLDGAPAMGGWGPPNTAEPGSPCRPAPIGPSVRTSPSRASFPAVRSAGGGPPAPASTPATHRAAGPTLTTNDILYSYYGESSPISLGYARAKATRRHTHHHDSPYGPRVRPGLERGAGRALRPG